MTTPQFNLLDNPWIIVTNLQGEEEILSLTEALVRSHELRSLSGEMPAQDIAIMRLLLGVMYAVYTRTDAYNKARADDSSDQCIEIWRKIWEPGRFDEKIINDYLAEWYDRFWLVHPERPFYQVANINKGTDSTTAKMIGDVAEGGNKVQLFSSRYGKNKESLDYPEAVRWLIHLNGFDDAAAKPSEKDLPSMSVGWLGQLGFVYIAGKNLFETLMLNFALVNDSKPWESGKATWELETPRIMERVEIGVPKSGEGLFTLQSRRIQLKWVDDQLVGYVLLGGDKFDKSDAFAEPMTTWQYIKGKKGERDIHQPPSNAARNPSKQLWRDFEPLLSKAEDKYNRQAGVIKWLADLEEKEIIDINHIRICTLSIKYGNMQSGVDDVWGDFISINAKILSNIGQGWITRIVKLVEDTEAMVYELGRLATNIAKCAGASENKTGSALATTHAYNALDMPFRQWLAAIDPIKDDMDQKDDEWLLFAKRMVESLGQDLITQASETAFVGRNITEKGKTNYYSAPKVYGWFKARIYKIITKGES